jgi:hypothetical protein
LTKEKSCLLYSKLAVAEGEDVDDGEGVNG